jgi:uncharacterized protein YndB with AHSA1/START domain
MDSLNFESFTKKIYLKAPMNKIYLSWATEAGICAWFLRKAKYSDPSGRNRAPDLPVLPGDRYTWEWHNWEGKEQGEILEANGKDFLAFTFAGPCTVSVNLEAKGDKVLLSLEQSGIPTDEQTKMNTYVGCSNGWTFWLANLKAYLEYGVLLNETEEDLTKVPLAGHIFVNM